MQIHELTPKTSLASTDVIALDTGSVTNKITGANLAASLKTIGSLVTGVKGNAESTYRTGQVNITAANVGLGNANNPVVLVQADNTISAIYNKLNALPLSPANGAGVPCHISPNAMNLLTDGKVTSAELVGLITRTSTNGYRIFGMYGATGYMMYWAVTVTNSAITPNTVFKLQGTAM